MNNKFNNISVKWKLFAYFALLTIVMLILLWLMQIIFLDSFYKSIKTQELKSAFSSISKNIDNADIQALIDEIARSSDIDIRILDSNAETLYTSDFSNNSAILMMPPDKLKELFSRTETSGGELWQRFNNNKGADTPDIKPGNFIGNMPPPNNRTSENIIYSKIVTTADANRVLIILNSTLTPVNSTVQTLKVQFYYVALIFIISSFFIAIWLSKKISKPIVKLNDCAKNLAKENFNIEFNGQGYREIAELSHTLDFAAKELSKVDELRRELIANVSHDLRTPLTMIAGYSEAIRDIPGENSPENIQIIIDEAKRLTCLVNDILDISKLQSTQQSPQLTDFDLTHTIAEILKRYEKFIKQDGYCIYFERNENVFIRGDKMRIEQVIYNLMNNAVNYTGLDKKVVVRQLIIDDIVRIEVIDTGDGIDKDKLAYIWDRYYKIDKTHKRAVVGTGLGLSIVKSVLELHNAKYGVESEKNGTVFWFELKQIKFNEF